MLFVDGAADVKEGNMRDFAQRCNGHKVKSPEVDGLAFWKPEQGNSRSAKGTL